MAEQFLHASQVRTVVEHVRREAVAQRVRADARIQAGLGQVFVQLSAYASCAEPFAVLVDEECFLVEVG